MVTDCGVLLIVFCTVTAALSVENYTGTCGTTAKNVKCQRWDTQSPHKHGYSDPGKFPDETLEDAANYCRDPSGAGFLWCYTTNQHSRWEKCDLRHCSVAPLGPPQNVTIKSCDGQSVVLAWDSRRGGSDVLLYWVFIDLSSDPDNWINYQNISGGTLETELALPPGVTFNFRLKASYIGSVPYDGYFTNTEMSEPTSQNCSTFPDRPYENPKGVHTLTYKENRLIIGWEPMPRLLHNGPGFRYKITWWKHEQRNVPVERHVVHVNDPDVDQWETYVPETYIPYGIIIQAENSLGPSAATPQTIYGFSGEGKPVVTSTHVHVDLWRNDPHVIHLTWRAVDTSRHQMNGEFKGYRIRYWKASEERDDGKHQDVLPISRDLHHEVLNAWVKGLPASTAFKIQISVLNMYHEGPPTDPIDFTTLQEQKPSAPYPVTIKSCGGSQVQLTWEADLEDSIDHFLLQYNTSDNATQWHQYDIKIPGDERSANIVMPPWGVYAFRMIAHNFVGDSEPSWPTETNCSTPPETPYTNPTNLHTITDKPGRLVIAWTPMPRILHNGPGLRYRVTYKKEDSNQGYSEGMTVDDPDQGMVEVDTHTNTYSLYKITIRSENALGSSKAPPVEIDGYSGEMEPRVIPDGFRLDPGKSVEPHKANFIWNAVNPSRTSIQGEFKGYKLHFWKSCEDKNEGKEIDILIMEEDRNIHTVTATIDGLHASKEYKVQVSAMNTYHEGPGSQILNLFTPNAGVEPNSVSLRSNTGCLEEKTNGNPSARETSGTNSGAEEQVQIFADRDPSVRETSWTRSDTEELSYTAYDKEQTRQETVGIRNDGKRMSPVEKLPKSKILEQLLEKLSETA